jgi:hypothetical protein
MVCCNSLTNGCTLLAMSSCDARERGELMEQQSVATPQEVRPNAKVGVGVERTCCMHGACMTAAQMCSRCMRANRSLNTRCKAVGPAAVGAAGAPSSCSTGERSALACEPRHQGGGVGSACDTARCTLFCGTCLTLRTLVPTHPPTYSDETVANWTVREMTSRGRFVTPADFLPSPRV